jgi:hypothetical protein
MNDESVAQLILRVMVSRERGHRFKRLRLTPIYT